MSDSDERIEKDSQYTEIARKRIEAVMLYVKDRSGRVAHSVKPKKPSVPRGQIGFDFD